MYVCYWDVVTSTEHMMQWTLSGLCATYRNQADSSQQWQLITDTCLFLTLRLCQVSACISDSVCSRAPCRQPSAITWAIEHAHMKVVSTPNNEHCQRHHCDLVTLCTQ